MTPEEAAMQAHLDQHPDDHTTRGVLADHLEEIGDPRAAGYRALAVQRKHPWFFAPDQSHDWAKEDNKTPANGVFATTIDDDYPVGTRHGLPLDWFARVAQENRNNPQWKAHDTRRAAEDAAALAFSQLPPERQAELLERPVLPPGGAERYARRRRSLRA